MKNIKIRKGRPGDAPFLAKSILIAGRAHVTKGIWEVVLDFSEKGTLRFLEFLVVTQVPHLFHYSCSLIAEKDDSVSVGSLGGYDPKKLGYQALQEALPEVYRKLHLDGESYRGANQRAAEILVCLPKELDNVWVIDSVAILPEYRGSGIAELLLQAILAKGKNLGYQMAQVNIYIGNQPALRLYQKFGFTVAEESRDVYFEKMIGSPGMLSLAKRL
jgi:ribosomal protein S18 acetylase RimI-like enzyme